jgi:hypothetical protein
VSPTDLLRAVGKADSEKDMKQSAIIFGSEIRSILEVMEKKDRSQQTQFTGKVGNFLIKLYPVTRLALRLTSAIAEVVSH